MHYLIIAILVYFFVIRPNIKFIIRLAKAANDKVREGLDAYEAGLEAKENKPAS